MAKLSSEFRVYAVGNRLNAELQTFLGLSSEFRVYAVGNRLKAELQTLLPTNRISRGRWT